VLKTLLLSCIAGAASTYRLVATAHLVGRKAHVGAAPTSGRMSRLAATRCGFRNGSRAAFPNGACSGAGIKPGAYI
jgi:hypothetical protein